MYRFRQISKILIFTVLLFVVNSCAVLKLPPPDHDIKTILVLPFKVIDKTALAWFLAYPLLGVFGISLKVYQFRLRDIRDEKELLIRLRIASMDVARLNKEIYEKDEFKEYVRNYAQEGRHQLFLESNVYDIIIKC